MIRRRPLRLLDPRPPADPAGWPQRPSLELAALNLLAYISLASGELERVVELGGQGLAMSKARGELWLRALLLNAMSQASWQRVDRGQGTA